MEKAKTTALLRNECARMLDTPDFLLKLKYKNTFSVVQNFHRIDPVFSECQGTGALQATYIFCQGATS